MKLNLRRLKLHPHESERFLIATAGDDRFLAELGGKFAVLITGETVVENTGSVFAVRGQVKTKVQVPCSRCLQPVMFPVDTALELVLTERSKNTGFDLDEDFIIFDGDEADISAEIGQAIFMALPLVYLCSDDCQGLCPVCGQDKNNQPCQCKEDTTDPRWAKLNDLR